MPFTLNFEQPFKDAKKDFETEYVSRILHHTKGNVSEAAKLSGKDRKDFYYLMDRVSLDPADFRPVKAKKAAA